MLGALNVVWRNPQIRLCTIHMMRNWTKKWSSFGANVYLLTFPRCLANCTWLFFRALYRPCVRLKLFQIHFHPYLTKTAATKFRKCIDTYLVKWYFLSTVTYLNSYWGYFHDINDYSSFNLSTNSIAVINQKLMADKGKISNSKACR